MKLSHAALKSTFINQVACGERHVLFLTSSGFVYSMGSNELGQLGSPCDEVEQDDGSFTTITYQSEPAIIFGLLNQKVVDIACGANHNAILCQQRAAPNTGHLPSHASSTLSLSKQQQVYVWGSNSSQQLVLPASLPSLETPFPVESLQDISCDQIICGKQFTAIKTEDHALYIFGMPKLVKQPVEQLENDTILTVCPYSDHLIFVKDNKVHRVSPEGDRGTVSLG